MTNKKKEVWTIKNQRQKLKTNVWNQPQSAPQKRASSTDSGVQTDTAAQAQRMQTYLDEVRKTMQRGWDWVKQDKAQGLSVTESTAPKFDAGAVQRQMKQIIDEQKTRTQQTTQRMQAYLDEVAKTIQRGQDWARENNVQGLSATESIIPKFDAAAYEQQRQAEIDRQVKQGFENARFLQSRFETIRHAQDWARKNNVQGLSATESILPEFDAGAYEQQRQAEIDRQIEQARNDVWTQYIAGGAFRPILEASDGINGILAGVFGESDRFATDNLERLDNYQQTLAPANTATGQLLRGTTDFLTRIALWKVLGVPWQIASGIANFGEGVNDARKEGLSPELWGMNGLLEFGKGAALGGAAEYLGNAAGKQIADRLKQLSPQQRAALVETLSEWFGVDFETLFNRWTKWSEESAQQAAGEPT